MTTQPSAGPVLEIINSGPDSSVIIGNSNDDVAEVFSANRDTVKTTYEQAMEYARLFVAAPDLLAALETMIEHLWTQTNSVRFDDSISFSDGYDFRGME